jgi:hypothetical protein
VSIYDKAFLTTSDLVGKARTERISLGDSYNLQFTAVLIIEKEIHKRLEYLNGSLLAKTRCHVEVLDGEIVTTASDHQTVNERDTAR